MALLIRFSRFLGSIFYPADVAKSRIQTMDIPIRFVDCLKYFIFFLLLLLICIFPEISIGRRELEDFIVAVSFRVEGEGKTFTK